MRTSRDGEADARPAHEKTAAFDQQDPLRWGRSEVTARTHRGTSC